MNGILPQKHCKNRTSHTKDLSRSLKEVISSSQILTEGIACRADFKTNTTSPHGLCTKIHLLFLKSGRENTAPRTTKVKNQLEKGSERNPTCFSLKILADSLHDLSTLCTVLHKPLSTSLLHLFCH